MEIIGIPTEQTTAVTDLILFILAGFIAFHVYQTGKDIDRPKALIWASAFVVLALASIIAAVAHGFVMSENMRHILWQPINLFLGLTVALFVVGVVRDLRPQKDPTRITLIMVAVGILFYAVTVIKSGTFLIFIFFEAAAMFFALSAYIRLYWTTKKVGSNIMALGILVTILAAAVQATKAVNFTLIWEFDHNGLFHILQMAGILILWRGLNHSFKAQSFTEQK